MDIRTPPLALVVITKFCALSIAMVATAYGFIGWMLLNLWLSHAIGPQRPILLLWLCAPWLALLFIGLSLRSIKQRTWSALIDPIAAAVFGAGSALYTTLIAQMEVA